MLINNVFWKTNPSWPDTVMLLQIFFQLKVPGITGHSESRGAPCREFSSLKTGSNLNITSNLLLTMLQAHCKTGLASLLVRVAAGGLNHSFVSLFILVCSN